MGLAERFPQFAGKTDKEILEGIGDHPTVNLVVDQAFVSSLLNCVAAGAEKLMRACADDVRDSSDMAEVLESAQIAYDELGRIVTILETVRRVSETLQAQQDVLDEVKDAAEDAELDSTNENDSDEDAE